MRTKFITMFSAIVLGIFSISCTPATILELGNVNSSGVVDSQTADAIAMTFNAESGTASITISANKAWSVSFINSRADDWISVSPTQGEGESVVKISLKANDSYGERSATLKIESEELNKTIRITQKQNNAVLISSNKIEAGADGKTVAIDVKHNIDYTCKIDDACASWISKAGTKALTTDNLSFVIAPNTSFDKRVGKITFSSTLGDEKVTVYQAGEVPAIVLSQSEYAVSDKGETISVEVSSNVDVEYSISAAWINEVVTKTMSTDKYTFEVLPNNDYDARDAEITFVNKANNLSEKVKIRQVQKDALILSTKEFVCDPGGETIEVVLQSNIEYEYSSNVDWITEVNTKGLVEHKHTFSVAALPKSEVNRRGYITFTNAQSGMSEQVAVSQSDAIIAFADAEVKRICVENWDTNGDGELSEKEAASVTSIKNVFRANDKIVSFKEFRFFTDVKSLPFEAFKDCVGLLEISMPDGIDSIESVSFCNCTSLASISIPKSVSFIGDAVFLNCSSITSVIIPEGVTAIGTQLFSGCASLTSVLIPEGVVSIGTGAFDSCSSLSSLSIPEGVMSIEQGAFSGCSSLTSVLIPEGITSIKSRTFRGCVSLTSLSIPKNVTSVEREAFLDCISLISIVFTGEISSIGIKAFKGCKSLTSASIPTATFIGSGAFSGCSSLVSVSLPRELFSSPSWGMACICDETFQDCSSLSSVSIPEGVSFIGNNAFKGCTSLTSVAIPEGVTYIGREAFYGCSSLTSASISSLESMRYRAFYGCSKLKKIIIDGIVPPELEREVFGDTNKCPIYVPSRAVERFKSAEGWMEYADRIFANE